MPTALTAAAVILKNTYKLGKHFIELLIWAIGVPKVTTSTHYKLYKTLHCILRKKK